MGSKEDDLAAKIEEIRQMFLQRVQDEWLPRLGELRSVLSSDWGRKTLEDAMFLSHTMAGSGATFGYSSLSEVARKAEIATRAMIREGADATREIRDEIIADLEKLEAESRLALNDLRS